MPEPTTRDDALETVLAAMAVTTVRARRNRTPRLALAFGAVLLAGIGVGALTAGAIVSTQDPGDQLLRAQLASSAVGGLEDATVVGGPVFEHGPGALDLQLGAGPARTAAAVVVLCVGPGSAHWTLGDGATQTLRCTGKSSTPIRQELPVGDWAGQHLTARLTGDIAIWAGQIAVPARAASSASQQRAVADGVVTRDEYLQAYARLQGCMDTAGIDYGAVSDAILLPAGVDGQHARLFDEQCYPREFQDVDTLWQSEMQLAVPACLARNGVPDSGDEADWQLEFQQAHLTPEACQLW